MAHLAADPETIRHNLARVRGDIAAACESRGRDADSVTLCVATKYVDFDGLAALREAGVTVAAENRLQDMAAKQEQFGDDFEWHFIGAIQSRKMVEIAERSSVVHSLATESARDKLAGFSGEPPQILVQVNVSGEESKQGIEPDDLAKFIGECPLPVSGLMTMPPLTETAEDARPYFAALREMAHQHGLTELSMGTSQDYAVAVEEGATLVRLGSTLFDPRTI